MSREQSARSDTPPVPTWADKPFREQVTKLLRDRGMSIRALGRAIDVNQAHLSRVLAGREGKKPSRELMHRTAAALSVEPEQFPEYRAAVVIAAVEQDPDLRDRLFRNLERRT